MKIEISSDNYEEEVKKSKGFLFVTYGATWCPACTKLEPIFDEIVREFDEMDIEFGISDVDDSPHLVIENEFISIPTMILYKDGKRLEKIEGTKTKEELSNMLRKYLP